MSKRGKWHELAAPDFNGPGFARARWLHLPKGTLYGWYVEIEYQHAPHAVRWIEMGPWPKKHMAQTLLDLLCQGVLNWGSDAPPKKGDQRAPT